MTKEQTKAALEMMRYCSMHGLTRRSRLAYCLRTVGLDIGEANSAISLGVKAKILLDVDYVWVIMTPLGCSVIDNFDDWAQDIPWADDEQEQGDEHDQE